MQPFAGERAEYLLDRFARDMFEGIGPVDGVVEVEAGGRSAQHQGGDVLFLLGLQGVRHFGRLADADQQDARCERIECSGMADLDFRVTGPAPGELDFADYVRGGPLQRFVDDGDVALFEVDSL